MNLLTTGKLDRYLADVDEQARDMLDRLMNNVRHRAKENVLTEFICA